MKTKNQKGDISKVFKLIFHDFTVVIQIDLKR